MFWVPPPLAPPKKMDTGATTGFSSIIVGKKAYQIFKY